MLVSKHVSGAVGVNFRTTLNVSSAGTHCFCSPILFIYFINELAKDITRGGIHGIQLMPNQTEMFLMLFADDLALLLSTVTGLQNHLNLV